MLKASFIFHRCRGLRCVVDQNSVDAGHFRSDALYQVVDQLCGKVLYGYFHNVGRVDGADDAGPLEGTFPVGDAGRLEIRDDGEILPYLAFQAVLRKFFAKDGIGFADGFEAVTGNGADAANAETRAGEGLSDRKSVV